MKQDFQFKDSKKLKENQRKMLYHEIKRMDQKQMGSLVNVIDPQILSNEMMAENHLGGRNLNTISYDAAYSLLRKVMEMGFKVKRIIVD